MLNNINHLLIKIYRHHHLIKISILVFIFLSCNQPKTNILFCDAETVIENRNQKLFQTSDNTFLNGQTQSSDESFSGKYSSKLTSENRNGMTYIFENLHAGDELKMSVWIYGNKQNSTILVDGDWGGKVFINDSTESKKGWYHLKGDYTIGGNDESISVCPYLKKKSDSIYVDDFQINFIAAKDHPKPSTPANVKALNILMDEKAMKKIQKQREDALKKGVLENENWVNAKIVYIEDTLSAKLRLKGDWTDHLKGNKWSYRIKLKNNKSINGMNIFSIQNPKIRSNLNEWLLHKLLEKENILTTQYDFLYVKQNNQSMGLYALEEHFTQEMLGKKHKNGGLIVCFSEDALWNDRLNNGGNDKANVPYLGGADIKTFSDEEVNKTPELSKNFEEANLLMNLYRYHLKPISEIFNVDQLAKYLALIDICGSQHGLIWHNQRMYFNPQTNLLEPIGFDAYTSNGAFSLSNQAFWGAYGINALDGSNQFQYLIFTDEIFYKKYIEYLEKYSSKEFLDSFIKTISDDLIKYKNYLQAEDADYNFNTDYLFTNAVNIQKALVYFKQHNVMQKNIEYLNDKASHITFDCAY